MDESTGQLLTAMLNMTAAHRGTREVLCRFSARTSGGLAAAFPDVVALADQWSTIQPTPRRALSPYEGADDLNSAVATQLDGVLFMEGEGEPGEITALKRELRSIAQDSAAAGDWLSTAMESAWAVVLQLFEVPALSDMLGERHRIIANDWQGGRRCA